MSYDSLLIHEVDVFTRPPGVDRFGQPREPSRSDPPSATYPCRLDESKPREKFDERSRDVVESTHTLFLPSGVVLYESDRVTVRNRDGKVLVEFANVTGVSEPEDFSAPHHTEAQISARRSGERAT